MARIRNIKIILDTNCISKVIRPLTEEFVRLVNKNKHVTNTKAVMVVPRGILIESTHHFSPITLRNAENKTATIRFLNNYSDDIYYAPPQAIDNKFKDVVRGELKNLMATNPEFFEKPSKPDDIDSPTIMESAKKHVLHIKNSTARLPQQRVTEVDITDLDDDDVLQAMFLEREVFKRVRHSQEVVSVSKNMGEASAQSWYKDFPGKDDLLIFVSTDGNAKENMKLAARNKGSEHLCITVSAGEYKAVIQQVIENLKDIGLEYDESNSPNLLLSGKNAMIDRDVDEEDVVKFVEQIVQGITSVGNSGKTRSR